MAIRPDYTIGTLTLTSGNVNFTTSGSLLQTAAVQAGDAIITRSGDVLIIASVTGQNSGTLFQICPASAAGSGQPLRIRFQPDGSRYQGAARDLIEKLASGNVEAIAGLTSAPDKGIMFTGAGTAGTFDLTVFARTLLAGTSAAAMRTTLGAQASLGFTPADKAGDTFNGVVNFRSGGTTQAQWGAGSNLGSFYTQNGYPAIAMVGPNGTTYLPSDAGWLLRNGDVTIDRGSLIMTSGVITSQFSGVGTRIRWGQGASILSALGIDSNGAGQVALYGAAGITYFSGDGANLLRGSSYQISRGNLSVSGSLSKGSGTFEIDHPTDPFNKNLVHGFVESTEYMNLYRGMVDLEDGQMLVDIDAAFGMMDGTFAALNADVMVTALQAQYVPEKLWVEASPASGKFVIRSENSNSSATVAWMISGRRQDAFIKNNPDAHTDADGRLIPEFDKED